MIRVFRWLAGAALAVAVLTGAAALFASAEEPKPAAEAATNSAKSALDGCITDTAEFKSEDNRAFFVVALENACERRVSCEVFANITSARGNKRGHGTLVLGAKSAGAEAKKTFRLRVKVAGGMAQVDRQCKVY